jgi:hypothetical protein
MVVDGCAISVHCAAFRAALRGVTKFERRVKGRLVKAVIQICAGPSLLARMLMVASL